VLHHRLLKSEQRDVMRESLSVNVARFACHGVADISETLRKAERNSKIGESSRSKFARRGSLRVAFVGWLVLQPVRQHSTKAPSLRNESWPIGGWILNG